MRDDELVKVFDEDADLYEKARPGYPTELYADLARVAQLDVGARVLEVGPGTGQATNALAERGLNVTAVERGPSLAAKLRQRTTSTVQVVTSKFEEWSLPAEPFDAVAAFTAWHWLDPEIRAAKTVAALRPGGSLATVTTTHVLGGSSSFFTQAQHCYERWDPATPADLQLLDPADVPDVMDEIDRSPLFDLPVRTRYEQELTYSTSAYLDLLMTYSGHRAMAPPSRAALLRCIADLIDSRYGGTVTKRYLYELRIAKKATTVEGSADFADFQI